MIKFDNHSKLKWHPLIRRIRMKQSDMWIVHARQVPKKTFDMTDKYDVM